MIPIPLETQRLRIRHFTTDDMSAFAEILADPEVVRYVTLRESAAELIERYRREYASAPFSFWALTDTAGTLLGDVGFGIYAQTGEPELGYTLVRRAWGNGYASEAGRTCVDALFAHTAHDRVVALVDTRNDASIRTAERIGFRRDKVVHDPGFAPHVLFALERT